MSLSECKQRLTCATHSLGRGGNGGLWIDLNDTDPVVLVLSGLDPDVLELLGLENLLLLALDPRPSSSL